MDASPLATAGMQPGDTIVTRSYQTFERLQRLHMLDEVIELLQELPRVTERSSTLLAYFVSERHAVCAQIGNLEPQS